MATKLRSTLRLMKYMEERENIRLRKEAGQPWPWTKDKILGKYKFTNVKRSNDRTTKAFVALYRHYMPPTFFSQTVDREQLLYNCAVARYFGTVDMAAEALWLPRHDAKALRAAVKRVRAKGGKVFTGAYIVTSGGQAGPKSEYVIDLLKGLSAAVACVMNALAQTGRWEMAYAALRKVPGFGGSGFMAKEVLQDVLLMWPNEVVDAALWTPMGPGARRGMNRLKGRKPGFRQPEAKFIHEVQEIHGQLARWWDTMFGTLGDGLTAHDVQFCLCEFDKYERTRLGQGRPRAQYKPQQ